MTIFMLISSISYLALSIGYLYRTNIKLHIPMMNLGIIADLSVVLILQFSRDAIQTAASFTLTPLQQLHILVSLIAVLLYFPIFILGWRKVISKSKPKSFAKLHIELGPWAFLFRSLGFALMFSMLK